jgi:DNA helicase-2/ATP-dependent DNA helicase PcrA
MNTNPKPAFTLSAEQRQAVETPAPLLVDAPPGGGKTSVLAWRVAHLISTGTAPSAIVALAFNVRAANELRDRLDQILQSDQVRLITVCTFHALGLKILRESGHLLGYPHDDHGRLPSVCGPQQVRELLESVLAVEQRRVNIIRMDAESLAQAISAQKAAGISPHAFTQQTSDASQIAIARVYADYQTALKRQGLADFDDLLLQPLHLLESDASTLAYYRARWQHILVDEFQDVSPAQYQLLLLLAGEQRNLTVIGDPNQSVYGFRGGMGATGFERFRADFPNHNVVYLPDNFRSTRNIIDVATTVLAPAQVQRAVKPAGLPVFLFAANSEHQEAELIVDQIVNAAQAGFAQYDQCAVLCRTNGQARLIEHALLRRSIPCVVVGEGSFFDHEEIKMLCACLRIAVDFDDSLSLIHLLDGFGWLDDKARATLKGDAPELLTQHVFEHERTSQLTIDAQSDIRLVQDAMLQLDERKAHPPAAVIGFVMNDDGLGYRIRLQQQSDCAVPLERIAHLSHLAKPHHCIRDFLDELDAMSGFDPLSVVVKNRVQIMTLHAAKGLEFKLVFVAGMEEGLIPHAHAMQSERGMREELRLAYVGLTRATDALCLSFARTRDGRPRQSSPWLRGLPNVEMRKRPDWQHATSLN